LRREDRFVLAAIGLGRSFGRAFTVRRGLRTESLTAFHIRQEDCYGIADSAGCSITAGSPSRTAGPRKTSGLIRDLRVTVLPGEVALTGRAATYYAKQLATHAALNACEEMTLTNDIEVF